MNRKKGISLMWIIIIIVIIFTILIAVLNYSGKNNKKDESNYKINADGSKINISEEVAKSKEINEILIEKSSIVYENGISKLTSKVTNNDIEKDNLKFTIKFIDNSNEVMEETIGIVGKIRKDETKYINSNITMDVTNAKKIIYEILE